jgi:hypothetical protein
MRMNSYAGVAWLRGGIIRKDCTRIEDERATQRLGALRKNLWTAHKASKRGVQRVTKNKEMYLVEG